MLAPLQTYRTRLDATLLWTEVGQVRSLAGLTLEVEGLCAAVGDLCQVSSRDPRHGARIHVLAEVVAARRDHLVLLSYSGLEGLSPGDDVTLLRHASHVPVGEGLLGRVIDGFGQPLDGGARPRTQGVAALKPAPRNPMLRARLGERLTTGNKLLDVFLTLARGQRIGLFAGSGVGKSTLLGSLARKVSADVNVVALIGERGREVREFVEIQLGRDALARTVIVSATADQAAPARVRAAHAAAAIAEHFAGQGCHVLFLMDSLTRFAMARREVGLSAGEPPTVRGYTPSVFAELPQLCERFGNLEGGGSVTAVMTVLVEGDDMNEPIADHARAVLDGHVVLSRSLAEEGCYPAIDIAQSVSRAMPQVADKSHLELASRARRVLSTLERNRQAIEIGLYVRGVNASSDQAVDAGYRLKDWMAGDGDSVELAEALAGVAACLAPQPGDGLVRTRAA